MKTPTSSTLYNDRIWKEFCRHIGLNNHEFNRKTYLHFDYSFDFPAQKKQIQEIVSDELKVVKHKFLPFVKILTKTKRYRYQKDEDAYKLDTKIRPIAFASHFDSYIYSFYSYALNERYQQYIRNNGFGDCVLAYRNDLNKKCNIQFAKEVFDEVKQRIDEKGECVAFSFFCWWSDLKLYS